jgi:hypothetical protein
MLDNGISRSMADTNSIPRRTPRGHDGDNSNYSCVAVRRHRIKYLSWISVDIHEITVSVSAVKSILKN